MQNIDKLLSGLHVPKLEALYVTAEYKKWVRVTDMIRGTQQVWSSNGCEIWYVWRRM